MTGPRDFSEDATYDLETELFAERAYLHALQRIKPQGAADDAIADAARRIRLLVDELRNRGVDERRL